MTNRHPIITGLSLSTRMRLALGTYIFALNRLDDAPSDIDEEEEELLANAFGKAREQLANCPAETIDDLRVKFDVMCLDACSCPQRDDVRRLFQDFRRLSSSRTSPIFRPEKWLKWFQRNGGGWVARGEEILLLTPCNGDADDCMDELEASGGCEAVKALIREQSQSREVA